MFSRDTTWTLGRADTAAVRSAGRLNAQMRVEIIRTIEGMERHKAAWNNLFQAAMYRSLGADPEFCINWCAHFGRKKDWSPRGNVARATSRPARPFLVMGWNGGRLDIVLPLRIVPTRAAYMHGAPYPSWLGKMPTRSLQGFVNGHSLMTSILMRQGSAAFSSEVIRRVLSSARWQTIDLGILPAGTDFASLLQSVIAAQAIAASEEVFEDRRVVFDGSYEAFIAARESLRRNDRHTRRKLESRFGLATLKCWSGADAERYGFPAFLEVDAQSWKAKKPGGEYLDGDPSIRAYYADLIARFAGKGNAHVFGLFLGGSLAAATLCLEADGILYIYKTSYKAAYAAEPRCRPGAALLMLLVQQAWGRFAAVDFMSASTPDEWHGEKITFVRARYTAALRWRRLALPVFG